MNDNGLSAYLGRADQRGDFVATVPMLEQMAKDAARYRWLRDNRVRHPRGLNVCDEFGDFPPGDLDAAIDAAMATQPLPVRQG